VDKVYTEAMRRAAMSLTPPKDFSVEIRLKKALEQEGAMVLLVRSELGDDTK